MKLGDAQRVTLNRFLGCMVGLAAGDALGAPVEFASREEILAAHGPQGLRDFIAWGGHPAGSFTDDTQMSLATAEGCIRAYQHVHARGAVHPAAIVWRRYKEWMRTQRDPSQQRAPGQTCLSALRSSRMPTVELLPNSSKGCGAVMRAASIGLAYAPAEAFKTGLECGVLTHGHPSGYLPAGYLAALVAFIVSGLPVSDAVAQALPLLQGHEGHEDTAARVREAVRLAGSPIAAHEAIERLGAGWTGDEALGIGVLCALRHQEDFREGVILAVNHSGDSDSTGCIAGAILGTLLGFSAIPKTWVLDLEDSRRIQKVAVDLYRVARGGEELSRDEYPPE